MFDFTLLLCTVARSIGIPGFGNASTPVLSLGQGAANNPPIGRSLSGVEGSAQWVVVGYFLRVTLC